MSIGITPAELQEETELLTRLTGLLLDARAVRPGRAPLAEILDQQAALCEDLANRRSSRAERLQAGGYGPRDLLVALLASAPKQQQQNVVKTFGAFVTAAEAAQAQIEINREFFSVALAAVEEALAAAAPESQSPTYDVPSSRRRPGGSVMVETTT